MINTDLLPLQQEEILREVVRAALDAVRPENFIPRTVHLEGTNLLIRDQQFDLSGFRHVYIAAIGKAAIGMAEATERIIGAFLTEGIALTKQIPQSAGLSSKWEMTNFPSETGLFILTVCIYSFSKDLTKESQKKKKGKDK